MNQHSYNDLITSRKINQRFLKAEPIRAACWLASFLGVIVQGQIPASADSEPEFLAPLENYTVTPGRDIFFTCQVKGLGNYRVAWIKSDSKAILALQSTMVAVDPRLAVTYNGYNTWKLYINDVQPKDSGTYMCQINTVPMKSQMGQLVVNIPPDVEDSGGGEAREGGTVVLTCRATGVPTPVVTWKREGNKDIILRSQTGRDRQVVKEYVGETLELWGALRSDMGIYYCIARNGVPPIVSRTYHVHVHFPPTIRVSNQLVAAPLGSDVTVQCYVEASPKAMNSWIKEDGTKLLDGQKYLMTESHVNDYSTWMNMTIRSLNRNDFGGYLCEAANALGRVEGSVRLQELQLSEVGVYGARGSAQGGSYYPANVGIVKGSAGNLGEMVTLLISALWLINFIV